jgi:hypothetical protein
MYLKMTQQTDYIRQISLYTMNGLPDPRLVQDQIADVTFRDVITRSPGFRTLLTAGKNVQHYVAGFFKTKEQYQQP